MRHVKIGITHGDINGIGYEVIMKALAEPKIFDGKTIIVYGSPKVAAYHRKDLDLQNFNFNLITSADEAAPKRPNIINCLTEDVRVDAGMSTNEAGTAAIKALNMAVEDLKNGKIDILVTMPVNKENVQASGVEFQNHTEYLAKALGTTQHSELFVNDAMKVCYVSNNQIVSQITKTITKDAILQKIVALHDSLQVDFGVQKPKIAVLALNGVMGDEETNVISKAVEEAKASGFVTVGPILAEQFFESAEYKKFDGVLGMYREQVVPLFKAMAYDESYCFSLGMPKICVSPAMNVDYNKVEKKCSEATPLYQAIFAACDLLETRERYTELVKNKLK